jgi:hypothetical protein
VYRASCSRPSRIDLIADPERLRRLDLTIVDG